MDQVSGKDLLELTSKEQLLTLQLKGDCLTLTHPEKFLFYAYAADPRVILPVIQTSETDLELLVIIREVTDASELREYWHCYIHKYL